MWFILETLRLYPQNYIMSRDVINDDEINGIKIKKGSSVFMSTYSIHRDSRFWTNPNNFDESRFKKDNKENLLSGAYFPFGMGARKCIGAEFSLVEMTLAISKILYQFNFEIHDIKNVKPHPSWSLAPLLPMIVSLS